MTTTDPDPPSDSGPVEGPPPLRRALPGSRMSIGLCLLAVGAIAAAGAAAYLLLPGASDDPSPTAAGSTTGAEDLAGYCRDLTSGANPYVGAAARDRLLELAQETTVQEHTLRVELLMALAGEHLRFGDAEEAVGLLSEALEIEERDDPDGAHRRELLEAAAVANLKLGELSNCGSQSGRMTCVLPLEGETAHEDRRGSERALEHLLALLALDPENLSARWLLNLAHMTLGTYPRQVPEPYLIPPEALESDREIGRFQEIAPFTGIYDVNLAGGSIVEDFDNDGLLDIMTSTWDPCGPLAYYRNDGDGRFSDLTAAAGLADQLGGLNIVQTDYNNDGWMDVLVMRGAWMFSDGKMRTSLLRNNGGETFTDVTRSAGLAEPAYPSQSAAWADYDGDGDLDLYSCNEASLRFQIAVSPLEVVEAPSQLFRNDGDGAFTDVAGQAGVTNDRYCKGSVWGDYDNDGDPDLYVSNYGEPNRLYRNDGGVSFADVAPELEVYAPLDSLATWFWDYDNDGWLDLFVAALDDDVGDVAADYLGLRSRGPVPRLYRNDGRGRFEDVTEEAGLARFRMAMGANFGDLDNDGFPDFYLGTGNVAYDAITPNVMYRNAGDGTFEDVTFSGGFGHLQKGHGIAFGDLDRDGDQDVFAQIGGFFPGDAFANALYENPGHGNRWITVKLVGSESNRAAIGARIRVDVETEAGLRTVYARVSSGGSFGASPLEREIGLGKAIGTVSLRVEWPATGIVQSFRGVPISTHIEVREGEDGYTVVERSPFRLGRAR